MHLKERILAFEAYLESDHASQKEGLLYSQRCGWERAIESVKAKWEEFMADATVPNQVNLELDQDNIDALKNALDREQIGIGQRSMTGYVGILRKSPGIIGGDVTLCTLAPYEAILMGLYLFGLGGLRAPEFLEQFGLKIEPGEGAVKS